MHTVQFHNEAVTVLHILKVSDLQHIFVI